jgi:hypothetical protein
LVALNSSFQAAEQGTGAAGANHVARGAFDHGENAVAQFVGLDNHDEGQVGVPGADRSQQGHTTRASGFEVADNDLEGMALVDFAGGTA